MSRKILVSQTEKVSLYGLERTSQSFLKKQFILEFLNKLPEESLLALVNFKCLNPNFPPYKPTKIESEKLQELMNEQNAEFSAHLTIEI